MTNKEAFSVVIQIASINDNTLALGLIEAGIEQDATFVKGDLAKLEIAAIPILQGLMSITALSEGGFSQSINKDAIKERLLFLAKKHGLDDVLNNLSDVPKIQSIDAW